MKTLPSPIVWDQTRKNVPDRQLCVNFENRQKVLNHSTLLTAPKYSLAIIFFQEKILIHVSTTEKHIPGSKHSLNRII